MKLVSFNTGIQQKSKNALKTNQNISFKHTSNQLDLFKSPTYEFNNGMYYQVLPKAKVPIGPKLPVTTSQMLNEIANNSSKPELVRQSTNELYQTAATAYNPVAHQIDRKPIQDYVARIEDPAILTPLVSIVDTMIAQDRKASQCVFTNNACSEKVKLPAMKDAITERLRLLGRQI